MVESVEVIVVGHVMCDDLSVDDVALALLTDFVQSLMTEGKWCVIACHFGRCFKLRGSKLDKVELNLPVSHWLWMFWGPEDWIVRWCT